MNDLQHLITAFDPITLAEMDDVKLMNRCDTKFAFSGSSLAHVLERLFAEYRILEVGGLRGTGYRSLYFDTPELTHYHDHHNGRSFRSKVRYREYVGTGLNFLEVKRRTGRGDTRKKRIAVERIPEGMSDDHQRFVADLCGRQLDLLPALWNHYTRLTFVHRERPERLTIDRDLSFDAQDGPRTINGLCIAELKQPGADRRSPFTEIMRNMGLRPGGLSKYCLGMVLLRPSIKHNAFNEALRGIHRITSTT